MILRECKCVSVPKKLLVSEKNNNRQFYITYWRVVDDIFPSGVYFSHFQWADTAKTVYREGVTAQCVMIHGEYHILES